MIHKTCFYTGIKYKFYTSFNVQRRETKLFLKKTNTQNTYHIYICVVTTNSYYCYLASFLSPDLNTTY